LLPDGRMLNWLFYGAGHLHQINIAQPGQDGAHEVIADMERDALHREVERSQGAASSRYGYDPAGRLVHHRAGHRASGNVANGRAAQPVLERAYAYDLSGQLVARGDTLRGRQDFRYDPTGRILAALPGAGSHQPRELFAFDPAGNLLDGSEAQVGRHHSSEARTGLGVVGDNRLRFYQDLHFEYDVHGNVIKRTRGNRQGGNASITTLRWNANHQLVEATTERHGVTQTTRYAYDALGRRVSKADSFGATHFLWDGDLMVLKERGGNGALFVYEPDSFVPLASIQGTEENRHTYWYQCDQIGAPLELTDAQGQIAWAADYKVWGEATLRTVARTGTDDGPSRRRMGNGPGMDWSDGASTRSSAPPPIEQPFRFQGQQFDEETGLHYNRFRYYDSTIGRFVSQDPIGLNGGLNLFIYGANSLNWLDPLGLNTRKRTEKPNQSRRKCDCEKWKIERVDRICEGHVPGVGRVKIMRDPKDGKWYSEDQTGHGGSAWKVFNGNEKNMTWEADLDEYGDVMSKHKGEAGKSIDTSKMKCKNT
ncbi:RHS repeat-associated core domain-containing protein, partial [Acidovorax sp. SUPP3334]|uniref:RHS repeat-associated core domain-containing protein n=1 Tax=Acidovorax sp. SUPP3334 TaxID=2920881 RepID=UPI0024E08BCF